MKKIIKSTLVVADLAVSAAIGYEIYGDSVMGVCDPCICNSEAAIKEAKKHGYTANSGHSHGFMKCDVDLLKL